MHVTNEEHSHCGCGCGGHGHDHGHDHEHTHGDVTHSHAHSHEPGHEHDHNHEHGGCGHDHSHCGHAHGEQPKDEDTAVLAYMLDHNRHHAQELAEIAKHLREQGKEEAAAQIEKGVEDFEKGNMRLSIALSLVQ
ncbi:MAG: cobalt transporter [Eubacteriales bacterium]|nr:cobalt transporter [Eubacteriales bacterium]